MALDPRALEEKARKTLQSASGWSFFSNKEDKYQTAADLYTQAANAYRLENRNQEAGEAFIAAANIYREKLNEPDDAANLMVDAFKVLRKDNPQKALDCIDQAIMRYTSKGNFRRAASHKENAGEMLEQDLNDRVRAMQYYRDAALWYEQDGAKALANKLWLKVADIAALEGQYFDAANRFEKVAQSSLENHLMKYSVKEYFLKAGLCVLATKDLVTARRSLEDYKAKDPSFASQRECQLLEDLIEAIGQGNQEMFTDKLYAYDQLSRLDKWKMEILLRIKNQIEEADNEFS
ncbi:vesicular-fusion protein sec17-like protein [Thermochaetoides thermophila DSM 1495]|uniref:Vesicular-fusion protein sec17-like protein n=1 Tax=Chaetomium thermophilum (strain DSM 1495 / CBS 144.50 / IMI 039719) TaxID=759272 RepID=G0S051_CHATD|nr:vesicular-fusion protein sec17-like protein [Thermochaetoides thermophila DSM 1495]EGS23212.1 vesicular-fusion protein sec17-like protein [Thermochaetoides thermophila DSM 1495]